MARKWNYQKREYDQINLPDGASLFPDRANAYVDMDKAIECAECGKRVISGDAYLSIRIQAENGVAYLVCPECHNIELQEYVRQEYVPECFDEFFAATYSHSMGMMLGYDSFEQDYYGLNSWETEAGTNEARTRMMRMTKKELLDVAKYCIKIFVAYEGLRNRYESLKAALDIIRDVNTAQLQVAQRINELYEQAEKDGFYGWKGAAGEYESLLSQIPQIEWLK